LPFEDESRKLSWLNWWSGERLESGYHEVEAPLDVMPIFVREGKGIPHTESVENSRELPDRLYIKKNAGREEDLDVRVPLYHDDGSSKDFARGNYFYGVFHVQANEKTPGLEVKHRGYEPFWEEVEVL